MRFSFKRPSAPMIVSTAALVVALGGTSYAAATVGTDDIRAGAVISSKIKDGTILSKDIKDGTIRKTDLAPGVPTQGPRGPRGAPGQDGADGMDGTDGVDGVDGTDGADGIGRWLLVDRQGAIIAQSGGFEIRSAYDLVNNQTQTGTPPTTPTIPGGAIGNVYIDANEDLSDNSIAVSIALQNQFNQDANAGNAGRNPGADQNPEFSGEITTTICAVTGVVACAPNGANFRDHFVVSPRNSDGSVTDSGTDTPGGSVTTPNTHKRFYVVITGDSSDFVSPTPAIPPLELAPNPAP